MDVTGYVLEIYKLNVMLIDVIVWPFVVCVGFWLFRIELRSLINRIISINMKTGHVILEEKFQEAGIAVSQATPKLQNMKVGSHELCHQPLKDSTNAVVEKASANVLEQDNLLNEMTKSMAALSPEKLAIFVGQRVIRAWEPIEKEIKSIAVKHKIRSADKQIDGLAKPEDLRSLLSTLVDKEYMEKSLSDAVCEVGQLGGDLVFNKSLLSITPRQILRYEEMSSTLCKIFESLKTS